MQARLAAYLLSILMICGQILLTRCLFLPFLIFFSISHCCLKNIYELWYRLGIFEINESNTSTKKA